MTITITELNDIVNNSGIDHARFCLQQIETQSEIDPAIWDEFHSMEYDYYNQCFED